VRNSPIYTTASTGINSFNPSLYTFIYIYIRNPFNLDFVLLNRLIKGILTFIDPILLSLLSWTILSLCNWSMTNYNCPLVIGCELIFKLSAILVSLCPDIVATNNNITALGGILLNFLCLL